MNTKIGFTTENPDPEENEKIENSSDSANTEDEKIVAKKSIVQVAFEGKNTKLAYLNDKFDLNCGDIVYVEGKFEGKRGRVTDINYNFKIKASEYKKVIALVETHLTGKFYFVGSHLVTFDFQALPKEKARGWFLPPKNHDDELINFDDKKYFPLYDLGEMGADNEIGDRAYTYYLENRVRYIELDATHGYAIIEGTKPYEVEFEYEDGKISNIVCNCYCAFPCKHQIATMLQLRECLDTVKKTYGDMFEERQYFAGIYKTTFFINSLENRTTGCLQL